MILTCKVRFLSLHNQGDDAILTGRATPDLSGAILLNVSASSNDAPYRSASVYAATLIVCVKVYPPDKLPVTVDISKPEESSLKILSEAL
jgi:hypothetical protein